MATDPKNPDQREDKILKDNTKPELTRKEVPRADHAPRGSMGYEFRPALTPGGNSQSYLRPPREREGVSRKEAAEVMKKYRNMSERFNDRSRGDHER